MCKELPDQFLEYYQCPSSFPVAPSRDILPAMDKSCLPPNLHVEALTLHMTVLEIGPIKR